MADDVLLNPGTGGDTIAADDIGGIKFQRVKLVHGANGVNAGDVAAANALPVSEPRPSAASLANVTASASNVTLLASNAARRGAYFFNDSTAALYLKFGATASTSSFTVKLAAAGYFELPQPCYTGVIDAIWESANGAVRITET